MSLTDDEKVKDKAMTSSELAINISLICIVIIMALMALCSLSPGGMIVGGVFLLCAAVIIQKCSKCELPTKEQQEEDDG